MKAFLSLRTFTSLLPKIDITDFPINLLFRNLFSYKLARGLACVLFMGSVTACKSTEVKPTVLAEVEMPEMVYEEAGVKLNRSLQIIENKKGEQRFRLKNKIKRLASVNKKKFSIIEFIPKSLAAHVDDISFSRKPTKILSADPLIVWNIEEVEPEYEYILLWEYRDIEAEIERGRKESALTYPLIGEMIPEPKVDNLIMICDNTSAPLPPPERKQLFHGIEPPIPKMCRLEVKKVPSFRSLSGLQFYQRKGWQFLGKGTNIRYGGGRVFKNIYPLVRGSESSDKEVMVVVYDSNKEWASLTEEARGFAYEVYKGKVAPNKIHTDPGPCSSEEEKGGVFWLSFLVGKNARLVCYRVEWKGDRFVTTKGARQEHQTFLPTSQKPEPGIVAIDYAFSISVFDKENVSIEIEDVKIIEDYARVWLSKPRDKKTGEALTDGLMVLLRNEDGDWKALIGGTWIDPETITELGIPNDIAMKLLEF